MKRQAQIERKEEQEVEWKLRQSAMGLIGRLRFSTSEFQVFWALLGRLAFDNVILGSLEEFAEDTGLSVQSVNKAMKRLEMLGVIYRGPYREVCFLNPYILWTEDGDVEKDRLEAARLILERSVQRVVQSKKRGSTKKASKLILFPVSKSHTC